MKTKIILFIIVVTMLLTSGCWDRRELANMLIVSGVAIDKTEEGKILLTLLAPAAKAIGPVAGSGNTTSPNTAVLISESGEGIMDAYRKIELKLSRVIFFSQLESIIIGERLARAGVSDILDFFPRQRETPLRVFILFTKGEAADILKITSPVEKSPIEAIRKLETLNIGIKMYLKDFLHALTEEGIEPIAPLIQKVPAEKKDENASGQMISISGSAMFYDDKLIGWINDKESRGVLWLQGKIKTGVITVSIPEEKGGGKVAGQILKSNTKITPFINGDKIDIQATIDTKANISENTSKLDLSNPDEVHYIEELYAVSINKIIQLSLEKSQKQLSTDVFGFGSIVYGKYPKLWESNFKENWNEKFPVLNINIVCNVRIFHTGFNSKSITRKEDEFIK